MNTLEVKLSLTAEKAEALAEALKVDADASSFERSSVKVGRAGGDVTVLIEARDLAALRAAANTFMRWIVMCENVLGGN